MFFFIHNVLSVLNVLTALMMSPIPQRDFSQCETSRVWVIGVDPSKPFPHPLLSDLVKTKDGAVINNEYMNMELFDDDVVTLPRNVKRWSPRRQRSVNKPQDLLHQRDYIIYHEWDHWQQKETFRHVPVKSFQQLEEQFLRHVDSVSSRHDHVYHIYVSLFWILLDSLQQRHDRLCIVSPVFMENKVTPQSQLMYFQEQTNSL